MGDINPNLDMFDKTKVPVWEQGQLGGRIRWINQFVLFDNLCEIVDVFNKHSIKYALSHGTMLGLVRLGQLIPWDDDIDLTMFAEDMPKMPAAEAELRSKGFFVPTRTANPDDKVNPLDKQHWYDFNGIKNGEKVEGWFTDRTETKYAYDKYRCKLAWDRKFFDTLGTIEWNHRVFTCPNFKEEYVQLMYGNVPILYGNRERKYNNVS